jgi:hypothetical protein
MKRMLLTLAIAASAVFFNVDSVNAAFQLRITSSAGPSVLIEDNLAGDLNPGTGRIAWLGTVDGWEINVVGSLSKPFVGSAASPVMDISFNITHVSDATATLTIEATDTGFTPLPLYALTGRIDGNTTGGSLTSCTYQIFFDNSDAEFGTGTGSGVANFSGTSFGVAIPGELTVTGAVPYSLTQRIVFDAPTGVTITGDANLEAVPAPAGMVLALSALPVLGFGYLRRRKATKAETVA